MSGEREPQYAEAIEAAVSFLTRLADYAETEDLRGQALGHAEELRAADAEREQDAATIAELRADKAEFERWRDKWIVDMESTLASLARAEDEADAAEERLRAVKALFSGGPDTACRTTRHHGEEFVEVPLADLCAALVPDHD